MVLLSDFKVFQVARHLLGCSWWLLEHCKVVSKVFFSNCCLEIAGWLLGSCQVFK